MSNRETARRIIDNLTDKQVEGFIALFEDYIKPNVEKPKQDSEKEREEYYKEKHGFVGEVVL